MKGFGFLCISHRDSLFDPRRNLRRRKRVKSRKERVCLEVLYDNPNRLNRNQTVPNANTKSIDSEASLNVLVRRVFTTTLFFFGKYRSTLESCLVLKLYLFDISHIKDFAQFIYRKLILNWKRIYYTINYQSILAVKNSRYLKNTWIMNSWRDHIYVFLNLFCLSRGRLDLYARAGMKRIMYQGQPWPYAYAFTWLYN